MHPTDDKSASRYDRAWMKFVGRRTLTAIERALADPDLTSLKLEIARVDARLEVLEERHANRVAESEGGWERLSDLADELRLAVGDPSPAARDRVDDLITELKRLAKNGLADYHSWEHIARATEQRRKLVDTERKYEELNKFLVPSSRLAFIFAELHLAIVSTITDLTLRMSLVNELRTRLDGTVVGADRRPVVLLPSPRADAAAPALGGDAAPRTLATLLDDEPEGDAPESGAAPRESGGDTAVVAT